MEEETIDQFSIVLTKSQAEFLKEFNEWVRRCETDSDKFSLYKQMHTLLSAQHNSVATFTAVMQHVMLTVCVRHKGKKQMQENVGDDEGWHRFIGVAADGNAILEKCLPHLKTASLVWGRDKIQHYCWHHRGWSFCKNLGTVARMMTWQEFVIKANRLLWRRTTVDGEHRRPQLRGFLHLLGDNELLCLRAWAGQDSYIIEKDPDELELEPRVLAPEELPDGFVFDKFGLLFRSEHASLTTKQNTNQPEFGANTTTSLDPAQVGGKPRGQDTIKISRATEEGVAVPSGPHGRD